MTNTPTAPLNVLLLDPTACGALTLSGNGTIRLEDGGLMVDSSCAASALTASGNASIQGPSRVTGGYARSGNARFNPPPETHVAPTSDPLAGLATPSAGGLTSFPAVSCGGKQKVTIDPGIYPSISASGSCSLVLNPGTYVLKGGGLTVSGNAGVSGSGVTLYNTGANYPGPGGSTGAISLSGNGTIDLSAPTSGPYAGVVIFQDRANPRPLTITGNAALAGLHGTVYGPVMPVTISGNGTTSAQLVVGTLAISGNGDIAFQLGGQVHASLAQPWAEAGDGPLGGLLSWLTWMVGAWMSPGGMG